MKWVNSDKICFTDNSALCLIHTKNLYSDGDELSVVQQREKFYCRSKWGIKTENIIFTQNFNISLKHTEF